MTKAKLILVPSESMDNNKKSERNEDSLVRMPKSARLSMGFNEEVEIYPESDKGLDRVNRAMLLNIFQAFSTDIKRLREGGFSEDDLKRVGFVTTKTYRKVTNTRTKLEPYDSIWITDKISDSVIGADPEFLLFGPAGNIVRANNVMSKGGQVGCDGAMAELRPLPDTSPDGLVANIMTLLTNKSLTAPIEQYDWLAGCYYKDNNRDYPIGGHIHIGNPVQVAKMDRTVRYNFFNVFNKILDELIALPMIKVDGANLGRARRTECAMGKYGFFGEWRPCEGRLEHRTLSGMWLMHPKLATLVLGVTKAVIDEVFERVADNSFSDEYMFPNKLKDAGIKDTSYPERFKHCGIWKPNFSSWDEIPLARDLNCVKPSSEMILMLNNSSANKINKPFLDKWYRDMRNLSTYATYGKYIDGLYEVLKTKQKVFEEYDKSIKINWLENKEFNI